MKKVLEVGGGTTPYFIRFDIPWQDDYSYTCVDIDEKRLSESETALRSYREKSGGHPREAKFVLADGADLPFGNMSYDTIVLSNILSAPIHYNWNEAGDTVTIKNGDKTYTRPIIGTKDDGDHFYRERKALMKEVMRVLKAGGKLYIYTDLLIYGQHSYEDILRELKKDMGLSHTVLTDEQKRIDNLNIKKKKEGNLCYCFDADVLTECSVHEFTRIY